MTTPHLFCFMMTMLPMAATAQAQETAEQAQEGPADSGGAAGEPVAKPVAKLAVKEDALEEILVTAQRRSENLQKIPVSVATFPGEIMSLLRTGGDDVRLLSARLPSLSIESSFGRTFPRFYIRGLGNTDFDLNASQPVSMMLDDVVLENPALKGFPLFDVERIEVLRGPQGTLFGRNTPAGVIKFESRKPSQTPEGSGRLTYGRFNFVGLEGAVTGPLINDVLAARVSVLFERRDDWVTNVLTRRKNLEGFNDAAGRFQLLFTPNAEFRALANVHAHSLSGSARVFHANLFEQGSERFVPGFDRNEVAHDGENRQDIDQFGASLNIEHDFGLVTLTAITAYENLEFYSRGDIDGGFGPDHFPAESADGIPNLDQLTQELRFATNKWRFVNLQTGMYYFFEDLKVESFSYDSTAGGVQNGHVKQRQKNSAFALFGSATVDVIDKLRLGGGVRYTDDEKEFSAERLVSPIGGGAVGPLTANPADTSVSWDANAAYELTETLNLYARAASGFRAPTVQGRILFGDTLSVAKSETILSYEAGAKTELFSRRARINVGGFYYTVSDQQLTAVGGGSNFNKLLNADESVGYGFEVDSEFLPFSGLLVTAGVSYNHTEIKDKDLAVQTCGAPCTVTDPAGPGAGTALIGGNPLPHAPEWIANATVRLTRPVGDGDEVFVFTDWAYRSRVYFFLYTSREFTDKSLIEGSLRLGYVRGNGRMEMSAFVRNLTNDLSATGGIDFNNLTGLVNEPRTWGVEATFRY